MSRVHDCDHQIHSISLVRGKMPEVAAISTIGRGPVGAPGADGYTPVKGVDYFDGQDGADGLTASVNGVTHVDGDITLDLDDIPDGAARSLTSKADQSALTAHTSGAAAKHEIAHINGLQSALDAAASSGGTTDYSALTNRDVVDAHPIAAITNLQSTLDDKASTASVASKADASALTAHTGDSTDPHGSTLTQTALEVGKATVATAALANTGTAVTCDFAAKGAYAFTANGNATITITNLTAGQRGSVSLYCDATARTITWAGVDTWLGDTPVLAAERLTAVTLFHDGVGVVGSWGSSADVSLPPDTDPEPEPDTTAPTIVGTLVATVDGTTQVTLSGVTATDANGIAKWQRRVNSGAWVDVASTSTTFPATAVGGLTPDTSYTFDVRAVDPSGNPSAVKTASAKTEAAAAEPAAPVLATPTVTGITATGCTVTFSATDPDGDALTYKVAVTTSVTYPADWSGYADATSPQVVTDLAPDTQYYAHVRAYDGTFTVVRTSAPFTTAAAADTTAPVIAGTLTATVNSATQVTLSGVTATDNVGIAKWQYRVDLDVWMDVASTSTTFPETMVGGLSTDTTYTFGVRALDAAGNASAEKTTTATIVSEGSTELEDGTYYFMPDGTISTTAPAQQNMPGSFTPDRAPRAAIRFGTGSTWWENQSVHGSVQPVTITVPTAGASHSSSSSLASQGVWVVHQFGGKTIPAGKTVQVAWEEYEEDDESGCWLMVGPSSYMVVGS